MPRKAESTEAQKGASQIRTIMSRLRKAYPNATTALDYRTPFELLVATILSAQCTDARVNEVTQTLFHKYRKPEDYLRVPEEELEADLRPTGFFRNKAKALRGVCHRLLQDFDGKVPEAMEEMVTLPGVARKTANVVLGTAFGKATGVVVDTHVHRLANRIGLSRQDAPEKIEADLMKLVPKKDWVFVGHALILHGRAVCEARKPRCLECVLDDVCGKNGLPEVKKGNR